MYQKDLALVSFKQVADFFGLTEMDVKDILEKHKVPNSKLIPRRKLLSFFLAGIQQNHDLLGELEERWEKVKRSRYRANKSRYCRKRVNKNT